MAYLCSVLIQLRTRYISYTKSVIDALAKISISSLPPKTSPSNPKSDNDRLNNRITRSNLDNSQSSLDASSNSFQAIDDDDMDPTDYSTSTHNNELSTAKVETWTDYWVANEMPQLQVVISFYIANIEQEGTPIVDKLPEIDMMSYARGVGALVRDEETEDEGWDEELQ